MKNTLQANQIINRMITAEFTFGAAGDSVAQRVIRDERMRLQSAVNARCGIGPQMAESIRVAEMWGVELEVGQ